MLFLLLYYWARHGLLSRLTGKATSGSARTAVYVDASYMADRADGRGGGTCGVGVWLPRQRRAVALKVRSASSMEGELLAIAAGSLAAEHLGIRRPIIYSDCKSAVEALGGLLQGSASVSTARRLAALLRLSRLPASYAVLFDVLLRGDAAIAWKPREKNREADLVSNIGSRVGTMGIRVAKSRHPHLALGDALSQAIELSRLDGPGRETRRTQNRHGTLTVSLPPVRRDLTIRFFARRASRLLGTILDDVA